MTMADEEKNETTEETPDEQAPEAPPEDAPPAEDAPKEQEAQPEESGGDSASPAEASQPDTSGGEAEDVAESDGEAEDQDAAAPAADSDEGLDWKTRKRLAKSRESGEAGPQKTPEERAAERAESQTAAAKARASYRKKQRTKGEKGTGTEPVERESAGRKERQGYVVSDKADKTITVRIDVARRHRTYEKIVRTSNTLHAHDESNEAGEGDLVKIVETRPLSKTKRWRLVEVMEKAK
jgi:small subunit ribosomal protein S17